MVVLYCLYGFLFVAHPVCVAVMMVTIMIAGFNEFIAVFSFFHGFPFCFFIPMLSEGGFFFCMCLRLCLCLSFFPFLFSFSEVEEVMCRHA